MPAEAPAAPPPDKVTLDAPPPGERPTSDYMADIASEIEELAAEPAPEKPKAKTAAKPTKPAKAPAKPAEKPSEVEKPAAEEKSVEEKSKAAESPAQPPKEEKKPGGLRELGEAYDNLKKKIRDQYEPEVQKLRAKVQELETRKPEESEALLSKLKDLESQNTDLRKKIAAADYEQDPEYQAKYVAPYQRAWAEAVGEFRELTVKEKAGENEMGEMQYKQRPADENDLLRLANMKLSDMYEAANEMFGAAAAGAIVHIKNIRRLSSEQQAALDAGRKKALEWKEQRTAEAEVSRKSAATAWADINKALEEKFPKAFKVDEADPDDKAAHSKGFALANLMFLGPESLTPEQIESLPSSFRETVKDKKPLAPNQLVQLHALARLKIANHDRKVAALKKATARIAELEKSLAEYEKSSPPAGKGGESESVSEKSLLEQAEDDFRAMDR